MLCYDPWGHCIVCQGKLDRYLHLTLFKPTLPYFRPNACAEAEAIHAKYFFSPVIVIIRLAAPGWVTDMPGPGTGLRQWWTVQCIGEHLYTTGGPL